VLSPIVDVHRGDARATSGMPPLLHVKIDVQPRATVAALYAHSSPADGPRPATPRTSRHRGRSKHIAHGTSAGPASLVDSISSTSPPRTDFSNKLQLAIIEVKTSEKTKKGGKATASCLCRHMSSSRASGSSENIEDERGDGRKPGDLHTPPPTTPSYPSPSHPSVL